MLQSAPVPHNDEYWDRSDAMPAKLAGIRHALRLVDPFGGGPASDPASHDLKAGTRNFDHATLRTAGATAAGIDTLLATRAAGGEITEAASRRLAEEIRRGLEDVSRRMRLT